MEPEQSGNPALAPYVKAGRLMGNTEGKEVRFNVGCSVLTAVTTSNGATGSIYSMHDSSTPLGGAVPLLKMMLGEMIFGGLGTGIRSILLVTQLGLFFTGLMIGRASEYLGKRIEPQEIKMLAIYTLIGPIGIFALMSPGKFQTDTFLFAAVIIGTAILVVAVTYLPVLALAPIVEHLQLLSVVHRGIQIGYHFYWTACDHLECSHLPFHGIYRCTVCNDSSCTFVL